MDISKLKPGTIVSFPSSLYSSICYGVIIEPHQKYRPNVEVCILNLITNCVGILYVHDIIDVHCVLNEEMQKLNTIRRLLESNQD